MKKTGIFIVIILLTVISCNKTKKMKDKLFPERPYEKANIDRYYWETVSDGHELIPLIKPYSLMRINGSTDWYLPTKSQDVFSFKNGSFVNLYSFSNISYCNIFKPYIYGVDEETTDSYPDNKDSIIIVKPRLYFIINTDNDILKVYENENDLKKELEKLNLPNEYLTPNDLYEQFIMSPVLPWFPEDIKKQLNDVKAKN